MTEHAEDPVGHASAKIVQYISLATMAAEAIAQHRQQRKTAAAATDSRVAAALRAQQTSARTAARLQWQPVLHPPGGAGGSLADAGLAWAASLPWRDTDPEAALAGDRALQRMRELRPDVMARFDRLTGQGLDQVEAMRRVAPFLDRPAGRAHHGAARPALTGPERAAPCGPDQAVQTAADSAGRAATDGPAQFAGAPAVVDDLATAHHDQRLAATGSAVPHLPVTLGEQAAALQRAVAIVLTASDRTPPELAADAYPEPLTGAVLAGGKVKPKPPDRTAPAAVRSTGLATASRASRSRTR